MLRRLLVLTALVLGLQALWPAPAVAYDNPDLLPAHPTPVIDLARALTDPQRTQLEGQLQDFDCLLYTSPSPRD